jgi:hypothetical protein
MKRKLMSAIGGIIVLAIVLVACKKELDLQPTKANGFEYDEVQSEQSSAQGNWLKFENRDEYENYVIKVKEILEKSSNSDSVLDLMDEAENFVSLRQFYKDTTAENRPANASDELAHGTLAAILNKDGILQIQDTIIRMAKNYVFMISNNDKEKLLDIEQYINQENIDEVVLPENVSVKKVLRKINEQNRNAGMDYNISYTEARDYWVGGKTRYKLVAGYICYSYLYPFFITEYYSSTKFEMGKRNLRGQWKWEKDWALPLSLNCGNNFRVKYGNVSALISRSGLLEVYGKREELRFYYWFEPKARVNYYFEPINMFSIHRSVRAENTLEITITKP